MMSDGARYTVRRQKPGPGPWLAMTKDRLELRLELSGPATPEQ